MQNVSVEYSQWLMERSAEIDKMQTGISGQQSVLIVISSGLQLSLIMSF
jgi:hypothetical protein